MKKIVGLLLVIVLAVFACGCDLLENRRPPTPNPPPHLIGEHERESDPLRPLLESDAAVVNINNYEMFDGAAQTFYQLESMTAIMQGGAIAGNDTQTRQQVKDTLLAAIEVLDNIILNSMNDYERVHAIHDWLVSQVDYDNNLYENYITDPQSVDEFDPAFNAYGALVNQRAVCAGLSRALVLLCAIENIRAVYLTGELEVADAVYIGHAWNKVKLGDEWFNVDCTYDGYNVAINGVNTKYTTHSAFLIADADMPEHVFDALIDVEQGWGDYMLQEQDMEAYAANRDYGYFALEPLAVINGKQFTHRIESQSDLNALFKYIKASFPQIGKVELQLAYVNSESAWSSAFSGAFIHAADSDFSFVNAKRRLNNSGMIFIYS